MALFTTFGELVTMLRAEARMSVNPAVGPDANTRYKALLNRVYSTLYDAYDWPHLKYVTPLIPIAAGQRYYDFPAGLNHERLDEVVVYWSSGEPYPLDPGIGFEQYASFDSNTDERTDPPQRFDIRSTSSGVIQIELWPIPASNGMTLQLKGTRRAPKLVNSSDICMLDDHLVATFAAAEVLAPLSKEDSQAKLRAAQQLLVQKKARGVLPQTGGTTASSIGTGQLQVGMRGNRAVVSVRRET